MEFTLNLTKVLIIFFILSILGLNIFNYLSRMSDVAIDVAKQGTSATLEGTKKTVDMSVTGATTGIGLLGKTITSGVSDLEKALDIKVVDKSVGNNVNADSDDSDIQLPKKSGYCFIGEDKGFRSCMYVGKRDVCMSGDIFPTMDVCINPSLRA